MTTDVFGFPRREPLVVEKWASIGPVTEDEALGLCNGPTCSHPVHDDECRVTVVPR